ncbi:MAG: hypothetical protein ACREIC_28985 [Limisphaerales bacterium]
MRKLIVLSAIAILAFGASPVLAFNLQQTFTVTGHLGVATSNGKCTSLAYSAMCPSANCVCYTATKTSLHTAKGGGLTIPPGTTQVAVSVDTSDTTSHPGCSPAWGEIQYSQAGGGDAATVEFFASLCKPLAPGSPQTFSGGGALTNSSFASPIGPIDLTGFGTATGTYFSAAGGQNLTLNLTATLPPLF